MAHIHLLSLLCASFVYAYASDKATIVSGVRDHLSFCVIIFLSLQTDTEPVLKECTPIPHKHPRPP